MPSVRVVSTSVRLRVTPVMNERHSRKLEPHATALLNA